MTHRNGRVWPLAACIFALTGVATTTAGIGDIDASYGIGGRNDHAGSYRGLTLLSGGRTLSADRDVAGIRLHRTDAAGLPDSQWGPEGRKTLQVAVASPVVFDLAAASDDSAYLSFSGSGSGSDAYLVRIRTDGSVDTGFGETGVVRFPASAQTPASFASIETIAPLTGGGVAVAVSYYAGTIYDCATGQRIFRLTPDGQMHPAFPVGGVRVDDQCYEYFNNDLRQLAGGVLRYKTAELNRFFDLSGRPVTWTSPPGAETANPPVTIEPGEDGEFNFAAAGTATYGLIDVGRYFSDLRPDFTFGTAGNGRTQVDFRPALPEFASPYEVRLLARNVTSRHLYVTVRATSTQQGAGTQPSVIARLHQDGRLDTSFGRQGFMQVPGPVASVEPVAETAEGNLLVTVYPGLIIRLLGTAVASNGAITLEPVSGSVTVSEGSTVRFGVRRVLGSAGPVTVTYRVTGVTATATEDFENVSGVLTWAAGETDVKEVSLRVLNDQRDEGVERFLFSLEAPGGGAVLLGKALEMVILAAVPPVNPPPATPTAPSNPPATGGGGGGGGTGAAALLALALLLCSQSRSRMR